MTLPETEFRRHLAFLLELATDANILAQNAAIATERSFQGELPALGTSMARIQTIARRMLDVAINAEVEINIAVKG